MVSSPIAARWVRWAPFVLMLVSLTWGLLAPHRPALGFVLIACPVVAAFTYSAASVAGFAAVSIGLQFALAARYDHLTEEHHVGLYAATVMIGAVSIELARQRDRDARNLVQARSVTEALQLMLLRPVPPLLGPLRAAGHYAAADSRALVGGDLYDLCETPYGVRVLLGDVRGKGLSAIEHVCTVLGTFRYAAYEVADLAELTHHMERRLIRESEAEHDAELFVTALFLEFPFDGREVRIADRGHPSPILIRRDRAAKVVIRPGVPLGLGTLAAGPIEVTAHPLGPGDVLVAHTDGLSEARSPDGAFYPVEDRLEQRFCRGGPAVPETVVRFLRDDVAAFAAVADDDIAILALAVTDHPVGRSGTGSVV